MPSKQKVQTCGTCKGRGHDKAGRPVVKFETRKDKNGKPYKQHVTVCQGSGCITCGGNGKVTS